MVKEEELEQGGQVAMRTLASLKRKRKFGGKVKAEWLTNNSLQIKVTRW